MSQENSHVDKPKIILFQSLDGQDMSDGIPHAVADFFSFLLYVHYITSKQLTMPRERIEDIIDLVALLFSQFLIERIWSQLL